MAVAKKIVELVETHEAADADAVLIERLDEICGAFEDRRIVYGNASDQGIMAEIQELLSELFEIPFLQTESLQILVESNRQIATQPNGFI